MDYKFHIVLLLVIEFLVTLVLSQRCPNRWLIRPEGDSCYRFWPQSSKTWAEALEICSKYEATLLNLDSKAEKDWIIKNVDTYPPNNEWWIGLQRHAKDDAKWQWTDGTDRNETYPFIRWGTGEPNNFQDKEDCGEIWDNLLNDKNCQEKLQFICERPADLRMLCDVDNGWDVLHLNSCYKFYDEKRPFDNASAVCKSQSAALLWISNYEEQKSITDFTHNENKTAVWLNIRKEKGVNNTLVWQQNSQLTVTDNYWSEAHNGTIPTDTNCVVMATNTTRYKNWDVSTCKEPQYFICKKGTGTCTAGYLQHKTTCVLENEKSLLPWHEADGFCNLRGTSLLEIKRESDWDWLKTFIKDSGTGTIKSIWLGLTGNGTSWTWESGTSVGDFERKMANESFPNGLGCGSVVAESGLWETGDCNGYKGVICTVPIDSPVMTPPNMQPRYECPYGYNLAANKCYRAIPGERLDWFRAQERCKNDGGQLATVHTEEQQTYLLGIIKSDSWIGLNDQKQEGTYIWSGTGPRFNKQLTLEIALETDAHWLPNEPYNAVIGGKYSENCVMMRFDPGDNKHGKWRNIPCHLKRSFICEIQPERNIALGKRASQSSNYEYDAYKAIDGCTTRSWSKECCSRTNSDYEPWWQLDLASQYSIGKIVIHRRYEHSCSSCQKRMRGFRVFITPTSNRSNAEPVFTETRSKPPAMIILNLPKINKGRFVTIDIPKRHEYLTLCEVQVFQAYQYRVTELTDSNSNCFTDSTKWTGTLSHTISGRECQQWHLDEPHTHTRHEDSKYPPGGQLASKNYCRDPDGEGAPWCYTTDPDTRWEFCIIPLCSTKASPNNETITNTSVSESVTDCGRGWFSMPSGNCFQYHNTMLSWADAKTVCSGAGGTLAVPVTEADQTTIISGFKGFKDVANGVNSKVWLGIADTDNTADGRWESLDGKTGYVDILRAHLNTAHTPPDHSKCVNLDIGNSSNGDWKLSNCLDRSLFACKKQGIYLKVHTGADNVYISIDNLFVTPTQDKTSIQFEFKGEMGASVRLRNEKDDYEVTIGAHSNALSNIQSHGVNKRTSLTAKLLSKTDFRPFYVSWIQGKITVGKGTEIGRNVFMEYSASSSTPVFNISVATREGKAGDWKFKREQWKSKDKETDVRTNLALNKTTIQTSKYYSTSTSDRAIDGCTDSSSSSYRECCSITQRDRVPWWQVDLGKIYPIEEIVIYKRGDCVSCRSRMIGYRVFISTLSDSTSNDDIVYQHKGNGITEQVVRIPATGRYGRYVKIDIPGRDEFLELCEVEVYQDLNVPKCGEGWKDYGQDKTCYQFSTTKLSWQAAKTYCRGFGAELTTIKSPEEQLFIYENTIRTFQDEVEQAKGVWIGVHDTQSESSFVAIDGKPIIYTDWGTDEPDEFETNNDCVALRLDRYGKPGTTGQWDDAVCSRPMHFVCQKQVYSKELPTTTESTKTTTTTMVTTTDIARTTIQSPATSQPGNTALPSLTSTKLTSTTTGPTSAGNYTCTAGWILNPASNDCYIREGLKLSWVAAKLYCIHMTNDNNTSLTSIRNAQEQQFLGALIGANGGSFWVGAHDSIDEGSWEWVDKTPWWSDISWEPGNPDDWQTGEDCGMIISHLDSHVGALNDAPCKGRNGFICRKKATYSTMTTSTTTNTSKDTSTAPTTEKHTTKIPSTTASTTSTKESENNACGSGWEADPNSDSCYQFNVELVTWQEAKTLCLAEDGFLINIASSEEQAYISGRLQSKSFLPRMMWTGANDLNSKRGWQWFGDSPFAYFNWKQLSPQDYHTSDKPRKDCAAMITSDQSTFGLWEDNQCNTTAGYICKKVQISSTSQPPPTTPSLNPAVIEVYQEYRGEKPDFTTHDLYELGVLVTDTLVFEVKTLRDAHILLQKDRTDYTTNVVHIILGDWGVTRSVIDTHGQRVANNNETNLLSDDEYRFFWISWNSTSVSVGKSNTPDTNVLLSWTSLRFHINYVSVSAAQKSDAYWRFHIDDKYYGCAGEKDGWVGFRQNCYLFVQEQKDWNEASKYCRTKGAELASIKDASEHMMIFSQLPKDNYCFNLHENDTKCNEWAKTGECDRNPVWMTSQCHLACKHCVHNCRDIYNTDKCKDWAEKAECAKNPSFMLKNCAQSCGVCQGAPTRGYWIGMYSDRNSRSFAWSDMSDVTYTRWDRHEPSDYKLQTGSCVALFQQNGNWNDGSCEDPLAGFVCKQLKLVIPRTTPAPYEKGCTADNSYGYGAYCYTYFNQQKTWTDANKYCNKNGAKLVQIYDRYVQAFVASELVNKLQDYWIGLTIANHTVRWKKQSTEVIKFTHFIKGFAAYAAEDGCFAMTTYRPIGMWKRYECVSQLPFICQSGRVGFTTTASTTPMVKLPSVPCPSNWTGFGEFCYKSFPDAGYWSGAQRTCTTIGASLASVHSVEQNNFLSQTIVDTDKLFLGLHDSGNEGSFVWEDGTPFIYSNWNENEPNNVGDEDCVVIQKDGKWNDVPCDLDRGFICQLPRGKAVITVLTTTQTPVIECSGNPGWRKIADYCYYVSPEDVTLTWNDAKKNCSEAHGAQLPSIHSIEEMLELERLIGSTKEAWVGLNDLDLDKTFQWSDGTPVNFMNWYPGEPNDKNAGEKCVSLLNGQMHDNNCNIVRAFVCKRRDGPIVPVSTTPMPDIDGGCQPGFIPFGNKCYFIAGNETDRMTWAQAKTSCESIRSYITSIHTDHEFQFILSQLYNKTWGLWIGLNNLNGLKQFDWADNSIVDYTNWAVGEPSTNHDDIYNNEPCVEIVNSAYFNGKWNDVKCHKLRGYICSNFKKNVYPTVTVPDYSDDCNTGYVLYGDNCYRLLKERRMWTDSQSVCQQDGGHLMSIMDVYEQAFAIVIAANVTGAYTKFWTGGNYFKGKISWSSGEVPTFTPSLGFQSGHNMDNKKLCVLVHNGSRSEATNCETKQAGICKMSTASVMTTTQIPTMPAHTTCRLDWEIIGDYCYMYSPDRVSFQEASAKCKKMGAQLASIHTRDDNQALARNLSKTAQSYQDASLFWIGLSQSGGSWEWKDSSTLDFMAFAKDQSDELPCVAISGYTTSWYRHICSKHLPFICKTKPDMIEESVSTTASSQNTSTNTTYPIKFPPMPRVDKSATKGDEDSGLTGGQIAGIVIGIIGVVFIIGLAVYIIKTKFWKRTGSPVGKMSSSIGFDNALFNGNQDTTSTA